MSDENDVQTFNELLYEFIDQEKLHRTEGSKGVENLCRIVRALGYRDPLNQMQITHQACIGDLIVFLEDSSGAVESIIEFIRSTGENDGPDDEWYQELESNLIEEDDDEEDEE